MRLFSVLEETARSVRRASRTARRLRWHISSVLRRKLPLQTLVREEGSRRTGRGGLADADRELPSTRRCFHPRPSRSFGRAVLVLLERLRTWTIFPFYRPFRRQVRNRWTIGLTNLRLESVRKVFNEMNRERSTRRKMLLFQGYFE